MAHLDRGSRRPKASAHVTADERIDGRGGGGSDRAHRHHAVEHVVHPCKGALRIDVRVAGRRRLRQARDQRGLRQRESVGVHAEVRFGRILDAIRTVAKVDRVEVHLENLRLGVPLVDLVREQRFTQLAHHRLVLREKHVARQLLGDGAGALCRAAQDHVDHERFEDAARIDRPLRVELAIFRGEDRNPHRRRHLVEGDGVVRRGAEPYVSDQRSVTIENAEAARRGTEVVDAGKRERGVGDDEAEGSANKERDDRDGAENAPPGGTAEPPPNAGFEALRRRGRSARGRGGPLRACGNRRHCVLPPVAGHATRTVTSGRRLEEVLVQTNSPTV